jgi:signal transduction histidine kinase
MATATVSAAEVPQLRTLRPALMWTLGIVALIAATAVVALAFASDHVDQPGLQAGLFNWIAVPYVAAGLLAWQRRPQSRLGRLMVAAGFATFLAALAWSNTPALSTVGLACDFLPPALLIHVCLAFPTGRLHARSERALVTVAYSATVGFSLVRMLLGAFGAENVVSLVDTPVAAVGLEDAQLFTVSALALVTIAALVAKRRRTTRPIRKSRVVLVDSFPVVFVLIAALFTTAALSGPGFETLRRITFGVMGIAPVAFLIGLFQARLARTAVGELLVDLRDDPRPGDLRDALARTLRDPTLTVAYWLPQFETWAGSDGQPVDLPTSSDVRATTLIERNGVAIAAIVHDPALRDEPELIEAAAAAAGIALENGRLHAELRARVEELAGSRARVLDAEQKERQRLERNLHDGAQQRLVALSLELGLLEEQLAADPAAMDRVGRARRTVALSLEELRDIARGIHPAVVSAHGLAVALEDLTAQAPFKVVLNVGADERLPEPLELAAYYLVCESLANIGKHANASTANISVTQADGWVVIEIVDDGVGGADTERGTGLRGLADRVEGLGGRLRVWSPAGHGTRVRAELPCAS